MTVMSLKQITSSTGRHYTTAINTSHESHHLRPGTIVDINVIYSTLMKNKTKMLWSLGHHKMFGLLKEHKEALILQ